MIADFLTAVGEHVTNQKRGMVIDLLFAVVWVTMVTVIFELLAGPEWAYYMFLLAGILAYFGFFWSLERARENERGS